MLLTGDEEVSGWIDKRFSGKETVVVRRIVDWAGRRDIPCWVTGDSLIAMLPNLRASAGWLIVSSVARSVVVSLDRLKGYAPFEGPTRNRLVKTMELGGFLDKGEDSSHGHVRLEALSDDVEWKILKWRLDIVVDIASSWASAASG